MKNLFQIGDTKVFHASVTEDKLAAFESGVVHPVYSTFALGRDAEWACRLFVLEMKEAGEEGIGAFLSVEHISPAPLGSKVMITASLVSVIGNEITCTYVVESNGMVVARGRQVQKIIRIERFENLLQSIKVI